MAFKLDMKKFKKVGGDKTHTILEHADGHQIKIAHKALSPKMRGELAELPEHKANGGEAGKYVDPKKAKEVTEGAMQSGWQPKQWAKNLKSGLGMSDEGQKMADGGEVADRGPYIDPKAAKEVEDGAKRSGWQPKEWSKNLKKGLGIAQMAEGGEAGTDGQMQVEPIAADDPQQPKAQAPVTINIGAPQQAQAPAAPPMPTQAPVAPQPSMAAPQQPQMVQASQASEANRGIASAVQAPQQMNEVGALGEQRQGIMQEAKAQGQLGQAEAKVLQDQAKVQQSIMTQYQDKVGKIDQIHQQAMQAYQEGKIDPDRYWNNKSTGSKVGTIIGLILGGGASGYLKQENPVYKQLEHSIDRDIEAQRAEMGKKQNLMSMNMAYLNDTTAAMNATKAMQLELTSTMLKQEAAKAASPLASARALQAAGPVDLMAAQYRSRAAVESTLSTLKSAMEKDPSKTEEYLAALDHVDPKKAADLRERMVPGLGFANTNKDAVDLKDSKAALNNAKSGIARLKEINQISGKSVSPALRAEAQTIQQTLVGLLRLPITGPGAMNEGERKMLEGLITNPTKMFSLDASNKVRLDTLQKKLETGYTSLASSKGLKTPDPINELPAQQQKFVKWARENPSDPRSQIILKKLGM